MGRGSTPFSVGSCDKDRGGQLLQEKAVGAIVRGLDRDGGRDCVCVGVCVGAYVCLCVYVCV